MLLSRLLKASHPLCMVHVADMWMASSSQPRESLQDVGEIEVFHCQAGSPGRVAGTAIGRGNSEHSHTDSQKLAVGGPAAAGARLAGSFSGSRWHARRQPLVVASMLGMMVCKHHILLGDLNISS